MKNEGESHTATGEGDQDSLGGGLYGAWIGDKGHFLDVALLAARLENDYAFSGPVTAGVDGEVKGSARTWAYGLGAQYGYRGALGGGWFVEPSLSLFAGRTKASSYILSNGLGIEQDGSDTFMGRLGLRLEREIGAAGSLYGSVAAAREFAGGRQGFLV